MVDHTPSYSLASTLLAHGRNALCFVGYCDPSTPGGQLLEKKPGDLFVFEDIDYQCPIRAQIERFEMSGHADREEILDYALAAKPKTILLSHGDPGARAWFETAIKQADPNIRVIDPVPLEAAQIDFEA